MSLYGYSLGKSRTLCFRPACSFIQGDSAQTKPGTEAPAHLLLPSWAPSFWRQESCAHSGCFSHPNLFFLPQDYALVAKGTRCLTFKILKWQNKGYIFFFNSCFKILSWDRFSSS